MRNEENEEGKSCLGKEENGNENGGVREPGETEGEQRGERLPSHPH